SKSELLTKRKGPLTKTYSLKAFPTLKHLEFIELERETLKRLKKKIKEPKKVKVKKPSKYVNISNRIFSEFSISLIEQGMFKTLKRDLVKANLQFLTKSYVSVMFFTAFLSLILAFFIFLFFLFFNLSPELPIIIGVDEGLGSRFLKVIWIIFVIPIATFLAMYVYPSLERKSIETKINQELPFATIHMSAISGSLVEPSKIFHIIVETKEYPTLEKELIKLINEINVFGHDLVTGLRNVGSNSPSKKLAELFNGLATTITSGGDLTEYFDKRAQSLLFEYRLEREKNTKSAETFMDIYISVVIAAPMVIMLLLLVMKISGLGIGVSTGMITLIMILGVSMINIIFLTFLHLKQPPG
ncbi:MAG: type II secretion system F family protein, partial [Candidatus Nanoarchaeia archaeon]